MVRLGLVAPGSPLLRSLLLLLFLLFLFAAGPPRPYLARADAGEDADAEEDESEEDDGEEGDESEIPLPPAYNLDLPESLADADRARLERAIQGCKHACAYPEDPQPLKAAVKILEELKTAYPKLHQLPYHLGRAHIAQRAYGKARVALQLAIQMLPDFYEAHGALGDVAWMERNHTRAIPHYEKALAIYPYYLNSTLSLAKSMIQVGRFEDARTYLDRTLQIWRTGELLDLSKELAMVIDGPPWSRSFTAETTNYIVKTDISQDFAQQAADTAEEIRKIYDSVFPDIPKPDRKYMVLVFDSFELYDACGAPPHTAGFYDGLFKRLNLHRQKSVEDTLMVLKHEGFHQYCHEHLEDIPTWFNEGLAEYFAASEPIKEQGKLRGMKMKAHPWRMYSIAKAVRDGQAPSIQKLMLMSQAEMYEEEHVQLHYSQAWSLCHFCIDGGVPEYQSALKKYFKSLTSGKDREESYHSTFGKLKMAEFERRWKDHVLELAKSVEDE